MFNLTVLLGLKIIGIAIAIAILGGFSYLVSLYTNSNDRAVEFKEYAHLFFMVATIVACIGIMFAAIGGIA